MEKIFKNFVKLSLVGFAVGVALSYVLPGIAGALGIPEAVGPMANPLWSGSFFASINGLSALILPAFEKAMDDPAVEKKPEVSVRIIPLQAQGHELEHCPKCDHAEKVQMERAASANERVR